MPNRIDTTTTRTIDTDGKIVLRVSLANSSETVKMLPEDWQKVHKVLGDGPLHLHSDKGTLVVRGTVRRRSEPYGIVTLHRVIIQAPPRRHVGHYDDDPFNLRRDNLYLKQGKRKAQPTSNLETTRRSLEWIQRHQARTARQQAFLREQRAGA